MKQLIIIVVVIVVKNDKQHEASWLQCLFGNLYVHISHCAQSLRTHFEHILFASYKLMSNQTHATQKPMTASDFMCKHIEPSSLKKSLRTDEDDRKRSQILHEHKFSGEKKKKQQDDHLHATSMVADWLFAFPRGDHA